MTVHRAFRWGIRALTVLISAVAAFGIGYGTANERFGFGQPGIVALVLGAAVAGAAVSNLPFAALLGVVVGYAGSAGIIQRLSPEQSEWLTVLGTLGSLAAVPCVAVSSIACIVCRANSRERPGAAG
ncbi:MAG: hypothetical protein IT450_14070 [Phycisphaerales bacterium]|nr:hypothetical protein [Phycisphaerales bacterium]